MRSELLKGDLDLLILAVLAGGPLHGYALIEALRDRSSGAFDLPEGTIYPALHRLEQSALLASEWREHGGRRRRVYRITASGRAAADQRREEWSAFAGAMEALLGAAS